MTNFFADQDIIEVRPEHLELLKKAAIAAPLRRARLCLHRSHRDTIQEMLIAFCRDTYNRPHRHSGKTESFHVVEGKLLIVLFDDGGRVLRRIHLGPPGSDRTFVYKMSSPFWHTIIGITELAVVHETTEGPFQPSATEFASWAPDGTDQEEVRRFLLRLGCFEAA